METERIALSQRERDRLRVLQDVEQGHLTQVEAAGRIHLCDRQVRRLLLRMREQGARAMLHGLCGRPSNRKFAVTFEQQELGSEWIAAQSPQAKGRIERLFETLQDRLVKEMRLAGIDTMEAANHFL